MTKWGFLFAAVVFASVAGGGAIVTKDGTRVEGELKKADDGWDVIAADGKITRVRSGDVRTIELKNDGSPGMEGLYSLRRSVETLDDFPKILDRYKRFIDQANDPAVIDEAKRDVVIWQQRQRDKMVRIGKRWVNEAERHQMQLEAYTLVDQARAQIQRNDLNGALKTTTQMLTLDPQQVSATYLQGVIAFRQNKIADARKAFDGVRERVPDHAPTLYNIAVLLTRQKVWPGAAVAMDQALAAEPNVQTLIDGAAELLNLIPEDHRKNAAVVRLGTRFAEQDAALAKQMAQRQMFRWGATWVDKASYDRLLEADKAAKQKIEQLQTDFETTQNRIIAIDTETKANTATIQEIESRSVTRTADGTVIRLPLPQAYYELKRQNTSLISERQQMVAKLDTLRATAKRAVNDFPVPKYTGVLNLIGEDGVPVILPAGVLPPGATSRPTSKPSATPAAPPVIKIGPGPGAVK